MRSVVPQFVHLQGTARDSFMTVFLYITLKNRLEGHVEFPYTWR